MCLYLCTKIQVSSLILIGFRQGVILPHPPPTTSKQTPKKTTLIRIKEKYILRVLYFAFKYLESNYLFQGYKLVIIISSISLGKLSRLKKGL